MREALGGVLNEVERGERYRDGGGILYSSKGEHDLRKFVDGPTQEGEEGLGVPVIVKTPEVAGAATEFES